METIEDILRDMREEGHTGPSCCLEWVGAKMRAYAERIEAAAKRRTMQCHSCDLLFQANFEADKLKTKNAKLKAALKPVLECAIDGSKSDLSMAMAIDEAHRIYKEGGAE